MIKDEIVEKTTDSVENALKDIAQPTEERTPPPPPQEEPKEIIQHYEAVEEPEKPSYATNDFIDAATETAFALLDNAQETIFSILANNKKKKRAIQIAGDSGVSKLIDVRNSKRNNIEFEKSKENLQLLNLDATVEEYMSDLSFSEKQKSMMRPGLKIMVEKNAGKIPPEFLFYAGLAMAVGANWAELSTL